jgi:ABC-type phosphate transport system permease subunit
VTSLPVEWLEKDRRKLRVDASAFSDKVYEGLTAACALVIPALVIAIALAVFLAAWAAFCTLGISIIKSSDWDVAA